MTDTAATTSQRTTDPAAPESAPVAADGDPRREPPTRVHRGVTLFATVLLMGGGMPVWQSTVYASSRLTVFVLAGYGALLLSGVLALLVRSRRALVRVDLLLLLAALAFFGCQYAMSHVAVDEGQLTGQAARQLLAGHQVYGVPWPNLFKTTGIAVTKTMDGGADYTYGYPPLGALLTAALKTLVPSLGFAAAATAVDSVALALAAVVLWLGLPSEWRSAGTVVCLSSVLYLEPSARNGHTGVLAMALLVPVALRWTRTGKGGRLGRWGVLQAVFLGLACSAQQLPWFVAPFLVVGLYVLRRGELPARQALAVVARYAAIAVGVFVAVCGYFLVQSPRAAVQGIVLTLTQHAVPHGEGLIDVSYYLTAGSARLDWYGYATAALLAGMAGMLFVAPRRMGQVALVMPWCAFYLSVRSQDGYYQMMMPLWLAAFATCPPAEFAGAWQPRRPHRLRWSRPAWPGLRALPGGRSWAVLLLVPALACTGLATLSGPPLSMRVGSVVTGHSTIAGHPLGVSEVTVEVTNTDGTALTPHFAFSGNQDGMGAYLRVLSGPGTLAAHASARYRLQYTRGVYPAPAKGGIKLRAVTDGPMTISTAPVRLPAG